MNIETAAINVINTPRIDAYIQELLKQSENNDHRVQKWIKSNLRNWIVREDNPNRIHLTSRQQFSMLGIHMEPPWLQGKPLPPNLYFVPLNPKLKTEVTHALHYVTFAVSTGQVKDITALQVPKAIADGHTMAETNRQILIDQHFESEGVERICNGAQGRYWVTIKTEEGLKRESKFMGHCVGWEDKPYRQLLTSGSIEIWSLRDSHNRPHVTATCDLRTRMLDQMRSKGVGAQRDGGAAAIGDQFTGMAERYWPDVWKLFASQYCKDRVRKILAYELNLNFKKEAVWQPHVQGYEIV